MYRKYVKRFLDVVISVLVLIMLSPLILMIMVALLISNRGSAFFLQDRPGKNESTFRVIKFKSMNDLRDDSGELLPDKERLTRIGAFVRKTSLDEIPQLLNVILGDMSLVGPRPLLVRYLPYYSERERLRHSVRPGITGLAQVSGRNAISWEDKLELDVLYVEKVSFLLDLKILILTFVKILKREDILDTAPQGSLDNYRKGLNNDK